MSQVTKPLDIHTYAPPSLQALSDQIVVAARIACLPEDLDAPCSPPRFWIRQTYRDDHNWPRIIVELMTTDMYGAEHMLFISEPVTVNPALPQSLWLPATVGEELTKLRTYVQDMAKNRMSTMGDARRMGSGTTYHEK